MLIICVCSKKKIRQFVFLQTTTDSNTSKSVGTTKSHMVQFERKICTGSVTQAGRHAETWKRVDIYKSASVACARATGAGQTVCDTRRQAGRDTKKGWHIRAEDYLISPGCHIGTGILSMSTVHFLFVTIDVADEAATTRKPRACVTARPVYRCRCLPFSQQPKICAMFARKNDA